MTEYTDTDTNPLAFTPVPMLRRRRNGWTPERQALFIDSLAQCGSVTMAARSVRMSPRSAYALLDKDGSDSFAKAWDQAVMMGIDALRGAVMDRAMNGGWVPVTRHGRVVGRRFRYFDRLACSILSGRGRDIDEINEDRARRRESKRFWKEQNRLRDEAQRAEAEARERQQREYDEQIARYAELARARREPRIVML
jgi:hypothetical protein